MKPPLLRLRLAIHLYVILGTLSVTQVTAAASAQAIPMTTIKPSTTVIATGLDFPEGPSLSPDGTTLYCVNVGGHTLSRFDLKTGITKLAWVTLPGEGRGNGSTMGPDGALYITDVGRKSIDRVALHDGAVTVIVNKSDAGSVLNGPNDIVFDSHGGFYFTDPKDFNADPAKWNGSIYYVKPHGHSATKVLDTLAFPNGLAVSKDGRTLYFNEGALGTLSAVDITKNGPKPGVVKRHLCTFGDNAQPDGMRVGPDGNIYQILFGYGQLVTVSPVGAITARYSLGEKTNPTNLCFTPDGKSVYVTETTKNQMLHVRLR